jgi:hypothetical protein
VGDVFDLDALARDATAEPFHFRFDGREYDLPARPDIRFFAALEAEKLNDALRILLGTGQWDEIMRSEAVLDDTMLAALLKAYLGHVGVELPE